MKRLVLSFILIYLITYLTYLMSIYLFAAPAAAFNCIGYDCTCEVCFFGYCEEETAYEIVEVCPLLDLSLFADDGDYEFWVRNRDFGGCPLHIRGTFDGEDFTFKGSTCGIPFSCFCDGTE